MSSALPLPEVADSAGAGDAVSRPAVRGSRRAAFELERRTWPNSQFSRFVVAGGLDWHVQEMGAGPPVLLLHGTGSSSHSWRDVAPLLAQRMRVIAPDLPGHGFTSTPAFPHFTLSGMATLVRELLHAIGVSPVVVVGHSAGAAVLARMSLDRLIDPSMVISINGALLPLAGFPRWLFAPLARAMACLPFVPQLTARRAADARAIERLIAGTGSRLDAAGLRMYQQLVQSPTHVQAALSMMANWDLEPLARDLCRFNTPLYLFTGSVDHTIPPGDAARVAALTSSARVISLGVLGHLAHEEQPRRCVDAIFGLATDAHLFD